MATEPFSCYRRRYILVLGVSRQHIHPFCRMCPRKEVKREIANGRGVPNVWITTVCAVPNFLTSERRRQSRLGYEESGSNEYKKNLSKEQKSHDAKLRVPSKNGNAFPFLGEKVGYKRNKKEAMQRSGRVVV